MSKNVFDSRIYALHCLRCNLKSLIAESKIIRQEIKRASPVYLNFLSNHRRGKLREELRYTNLALAFIRGRPYWMVERDTKKELSITRLFEKISRKYPVVTKRDVDLWVNLPLPDSMVNQ